MVAITGGARGIGRATAAELVAGGFRMAIGDLDPDLSERAARELGDGCRGFGLDVADAGLFADFLDAVERELGPLDVLVNNAGIMPLGHFAAEDPGLSNRIVDVNLRGVIVGCRLALERMLPRGRGHIVNVASSAGKVGLPGAVTYSATKHGVVGLSEALRSELRDSGIEISCVMPATVATELAAGVRPRGIPPVEPERVAKAIRRTLERPRFEVFVPRRAGVAIRTMGMLPRGARERLVRTFGADRAFLEADQAVRAVYADRLADTQ